MPWTNASFFSQHRLEHGEWDSARSPIIGSCGSQEQALLIDLTSNSCRRVRRGKDKERVLYSQTGLAVLSAKGQGGGMWAWDWKGMEGWKKLVEAAKSLAPRGFLSGYLFSTVVGEGKGTDLYRAKLSDFQIFFSDPEWCWMEAGPAFALSFPDTGATAGSHLLSDSSCPTCSMFHRPSINLVLTFWITPLRTWNSLTSSIKTINSNGMIFPLTGPLSNSPQKVPAKRGGYEHRLELQGPMSLLSSTVQDLTLLQNLRRPHSWLLSPIFVQILQGPDLLWSYERCWGMSFSQEDSSNKPNNQKSNIILIDTFFVSCTLYFLLLQREGEPAINNGRGNVLGNIIS